MGKRKKCQFIVLSHFSDLENVVQSEVSETLAGDAERAGGFFDLVRFVPRRLSVLHLGDFHILTHPVEVLLGLLELPHIPDKYRSIQKNFTLDPNSTKDLGRLQILRYL